LPPYANPTEKRRNKQKQLINRDQFNLASSKPFASFEIIPIYNPNL